MCRVQERIANHLVTRLLERELTTREKAPGGLEVGRGFNKRFAGKPDHVRLVHSTDEVIDAVQDAVQEGRRVVARGGGHCLEGFVDDPDVRVIIDTSLMTGVRHGPKMRAFEIDSGTLSIRP
jgi:FAD/FMN-containing dehydrogenase